MSTCGADVDVIDVSGHTIGHIAFHIASERLLFSGDSLMAAGCGRLFEGEPSMMWVSMQRLAALPDDTRVYFGHEYTLYNLRFMASIAPDPDVIHQRIAEESSRLDAGEFSTPTTIGLEKSTNYLLNPHVEGLAESLGLHSADPGVLFSEIRKRRDNF